jgi:hypothetical protein
VVFEFGHPDITRPQSGKKRTFKKGKFKVEFADELNSGPKRETLKNKAKKSTERSNSEVYPGE